MIKFYSIASLFHIPELIFDLDPAKAMYAKIECIM